MTAWTEPALVADGRFADLDVIVDATGIVHVAVAGSGSNNRGIWYATNASGVWTILQVSAPPPSGGEEYDGEPSITLDDDGSIWIAFTRWTCGACAPNPSVGIFGVGATNDVWGEAVQLAGEQTNSPSLIVRNGVSHLAYAEGMVPGLRDYPIWYTGGTGDDLEMVDRNGGFPTLDLQGGVARLLYSGERVYFAEQNEDGSFDTQPIPGSDDGFDGVLGVQPATGEAVAAWSGYDAAAEHLNSFYAQLVGDAWDAPRLAVEDMQALDIEYARSGAVHLLGNLPGSGTAEPTSDALSYAVSSSASGQFTSEILSEVGGQNAAMALDDATGQPHVIYAVDADGDSGLWYQVGPPQ